MGRTSLLNKMMNMDDELLEMMTVETKQTTISDFFKPVCHISDECSNIERSMLVEMHILKMVVKLCTKLSFTVF
jgi:putative component of membrane protein insertase Oxa1/YidC/SpoIIIJ protein YidD